MGPTGSALAAGRHLETPRGDRLNAPGFFLAVVGLVSLAFAAGIVLVAALRDRPASCPIAPHDNDNYLELFASGPGRGWYQPRIKPVSLKN